MLATPCVIGRPSSSTLVAKNSSISAHSDRSEFGGKPSTYNIVLNKKEPAKRELRVNLASKPYDMKWHAPTVGTHHWKRTSEG